MILRPYQSAGVAATLASIDKGARPVFVLPTGGGKTACAVDLIKQYQALHRGARVIFLAHRKELITQAARHLRDAGLLVGIIKAGFPFYASRDVQVASVQTLVRRDKPAADMLIFDECQHCGAATYKKIVAAYPTAVVVGISATPWHRNGVGLGDVFDEIVVGAYPSDLIEQGFLVEPKIYCPPAPDISGVGIVAGDYNTGQLARAVDKPKLIGDVVSTWEKLGGGRVTLAFGVNVEHSKHMAATFVARGHRFAHVDGETDEHERDDAVAALGDGRLVGICNCGLFGEGFDLPRIKCLVINRASRSYALFLQMAGRVMRPTDDGETAIILDHAGCTVMFGSPRRRVEYSLDTGARPAEALGLKTCPKCYLMLASYAKTCVCGYDFGAARVERAMPENVDGVLIPYEDPEAAAQAAAAKERDRLWFQLAHTARARGFLVGWVAHEFHRKTGEWRDTRSIDHIVSAPAKQPRTVAELLDFGAATGAA